MTNLPKTIRIFLLGVGLVVFSPYICMASSTSLDKASSNLPMVKSAGLSPGMDVPWSKPVNIVDPFEGQFLGVFDRNSLGNYLHRVGSKQVISLWTPSSIRVLVTVNSGQSGTFYHTAGLVYSSPDYLQFVNTKKVINLLVKVKEQVFKLDGANNTFAVSKELANALKNAPEQNLSIRLVLEGGETIDSEIGKGTVNAWRSVY